MILTFGRIFGAIILPDLILLYLWYRVIFPQKNMKPICRLLCHLPLIFFAVNPFLFLIVGGNFIHPNLPLPLIEYSGVAFFILVIFAFFIWLRDVFFILSKLMTKIFSFRSLGFSLGKRFIFTAFALAFVLACYGNYSSHRLPIVTEYTVESEALPSSFNGYKIAFITDIHAWRARGRDFVQSLVDITNAQDCKLVLLGGDYLDETMEDFGEALLPLKDLKSQAGIYAVPGNHEYYFNFAEWKKFFEEKLNIPVLINQHKMIVSSAEQAIFLTGVSDKFAKHTEDEMPDVKRALPVFGFPVFNILLSHRPNDAKENCKLGVNLQLSGHTHGGIMPFFSKILSLFHDGGYIAGEYKLPHMKLIVSRGVTMGNIRIMNPAEIVVVTLKQAKTNNQ